LKGFLLKAGKGNGGGGSNTHLTEPPQGIPSALPAAHRDAARRKIRLRDAVPSGSGRDFACAGLASDAATGFSPFPRSAETSSLLCVERERLTSGYVSLREIAVSDMGNALTELGRRETRH
jgi:hypothetical protein